MVGDPSDGLISPGGLDVVRKLLGKLGSANRTAPPSGPLNWPRYGAGASVLLYETYPLTERNRSTRPVPGESATEGGSIPGPLGAMPPGIEERPEA